MSTCFETFFSNRIEILYEHLKQVLFAPGSKPFKRRLIVVSGPAVKNWLMQQMAQDPELGIAAGVEIIHLSEAFEKLCDLFQLEPYRSIPSQIELACAIEQEILSILKSFKFLGEKERQDWTPILQFLKGDPDIEELSYPLKLSRKAEKRLIGLSQQIAQCFRDYGRYAGSLLSKWEKQPHKGTGWQQRLWKSLFLDSEWSYFIRSFDQPLVCPENLEIHFFAINFLTQSEFQFINRIGQHVPLYYYLFSPCAVFWSDIRSDKESAYLQAHWQQKLGSATSQVAKLDELLRDRNVLLANFGRLGREMAFQIEESSALTHAWYQLPKHACRQEEDKFATEDLDFIETQGPLTLLHALQADLLLLRNPQGKSKQDLPQLDHSIQMHAAPTKRREVEILYHNLLNIIEKNSNVQPKDIMVMAPDIADYVPYIQSVFGAPDSPFAFQILDVGLHVQSTFIKGFLQLLHLSESRWDAVELLQLFEHRSFQRRHQLTQGDYDLIQQWIEVSEIRWGETKDHRNELLKRFHCRQGMAEDTSIGTWDYGIGRLLMGFATVTSSGNEVVDMPPCEQVDFSQSELMGKWIRLVHALRDDLSSLHDESRMTLEEWVNYLHCLLESYFEANPNDVQEGEDYAGLKAQFEILRLSSKRFKEARFSFQTIKTHLFTLLQQAGPNSHEHQLQSIRFCSMLPFRSLPCQIVALMGMQEDAFPRPHTSSALNLALHQNDADYYPSTTDFDRYSFLETLHAAKEALLISYQAYNHYDGKELQPSLVIEELFAYLEQHYTIQGRSVSKACIFHHPFDAFSDAYFKQDAILPNYSMHNYRLAEAYYNKGKTPPHCFVQDFTLVDYPQTEVIPDKSTIDLKHLAAVARNPIKFYLNNVLEIYLQTDEDRRVKSEEDFLLSPLEKYSLKRSALKEPLEKVLFRAEKEGKLPHGMFKMVASSKIREEVDELEGRLEKHQIKKDDIFQIEFCTTCSQPVQVDESRWLFPALPLTYKNGYQVHIVGELSQVTSKGLLAMSKGSLADTWKVWPQFLAYHYAAKLHPNSLEKQLILTYHSKPKKAFFEDPEPYLKQFVNYYSLCLKNFSPLIPEWLPLILNGNAKGLQEKMRQLFGAHSFGSEYRSHDLRWILNKDQLPCSTKMVEYWKEQAETLLGDLMLNWFASKEDQASEEI